MAEKEPRPGNDTAPAVPQIQLTIDEEFASLVPPLSEEEVGQLEQSLRKEGCRDQLVVWRGPSPGGPCPSCKAERPEYSKAPNNTELVAKYGMVAAYWICSKCSAPGVTPYVLLDGYNRHRICQEHRIHFEVREVELSDRDAVKEWIVHNQLGRRNLTRYAKCELALALEPQIAARAKEKQREAGGSVPQKSEKPPVDTREELARISGVSHDTLDKVKLIRDEADEETKAKLRRGDPSVSINRVYNSIRKRQDRKRGNRYTPIIPEGKYGVLVVHPPWPQKNKQRQPVHSNPLRCPNWSVEQIRALPISEMSMDNAVMWLWTPNEYIVEAHGIAEAWGFRAKTILTWAKPVSEEGDWLLAQTEHCLVCAKGEPSFTMGTDRTTLLSGPAAPGSRRPQAFYELVDLLSPGVKCEIFGTQKRESWVPMIPKMDATGIE